MKIEKTGDPHHGTRWIVNSCWECRNCKALIRLEVTDISNGTVKFYSDQRDGDFYSFMCPTEGCGETISISQGGGKMCPEQVDAYWRDRGGGR